MRLQKTQDNSNWKRYRNSEYGFEITYPGDWEFDASCKDNYGKPSTGNRLPKPRKSTPCFILERDGPDQSHEGGGGYFDETRRQNGNSG